MKCQGYVWHTCQDKNGDVVAHLENLSTVSWSRMNLEADLQTMKKIHVFVKQSNRRYISFEKWDFSKRLNDDIHAF